MININDEKNLAKISKKFFANLKAPMVIYFNGDLGVGKTCFVRHGLQSLNYADRIVSPTYTIVETYKIKSIDYNHFDFYRINDPEELFLIGIEDYFHEMAVNLIEWPANGEGAISSADVILTFTFENNNRELSWQALTVKGEWLINKVF